MRHVSEMRARVGKFNQHVGMTHDVPQGLFAIIGDDGIPAAIRGIV